MNKKELDRLLGDFYLISGMEISLLDEDFHSISMRRSERENLCSRLHKENGMSEICKSSDIERLTEAKVTQQPLVYTCPAGITEIILPIMRNERVRGYIIASMGINSTALTDTDVENMVGEILPTVDVENIRVYLKEMKHLSKEQISAFCSILTLLAEHLSADETLFVEEESIGRLVKYYVKANLSRKITLSDVARSLHCSTVTLTEHFKREFGITVMEYVTAKRMQYSEKLLLSTDEPLSTVATLSGFSDVEYFSRTFKKHHGASPAAWRRKNK